MITERVQRGSYKPGLSLPGHGLDSSRCDSDETIGPKTLTPSLGAALGAVDARGTGRLTDISASGVRSLALTLRSADPERDTIGPTSCESSLSDRSQTTFFVRPCRRRLQAEAETSRSTRLDLSRDLADLF